MATVKHKAVSTITVAGVTLPIVAAPIGQGESVEFTKLGAFGDKRYTKIGNGISELKDITITALYEGSGLGIAIGDVISVTITPSFSNGSGSPVTAAFTTECTVGDIDYPTIEVDGERKGAVTIVLTPVGVIDPPAPAQSTPAQSNT